MARSIHVSGICLLQVKSAQIPPHPIDKSRNGHLARKLGNNERIVSRSGVPPPAYKRNSPGAGKPLRLTRKLRLITQMSYFRRQVFVSRAPFVRRSRDRTSDDNSVIPSGAARPKVNRVIQAIASVRRGSLAAGRFCYWSRARTETH